MLKDSFSLKFSGKRIHNSVTLVGIGEESIYSILQILLRVKIDRYLFEITFDVVPDNHLTSDILIGREILKLGCKVKAVYTLSESITFNWKKVKGKINWTPEHEYIRKELIRKLTNEPVLTVFNPEHPIELHTDASSEGYGAILFHRNINRLHPVEYFSRITSVSESKYHSYELETLAVVDAIKHFRHYLFGQNFLVVTYCNSLKSSRS